MLVTSLSLINVAQAQTSIYGGALTYHFNRDKDYNETNELLMIQYDQVFGGYFKNSYYKDSAILGWQGMALESESWKLSINPVLIYGYDQDQVIMPCIKKICPGVIPMLEYTALPIKPGILWGGSFLSLIVRYDF